MSSGQRGDTRVLRGILSERTAVSARRSDEKDELDDKHHVGCSFAFQADKSRTEVLEGRQTGVGSKAGFRR